MALYKYFQLSKDIEQWLYHHQKPIFTRKDIRQAINTLEGFYSYSDTTLDNAIHNLIFFNKVHLFKKNKQGTSDEYIYLPVASGLSIMDRLHDGK